MAAEAARLLVRLGVILLGLALLARLGELSPASLVVDDLACLTSTGTIALGAGYLWWARSRRRDVMRASEENPVRR
ncbi:hypothetical protein [Actinopolymorpha rutila]|uniref:Uncharacterized protein n=1 Tax=Actinopolymorpha rutila TaxID=446787 RepID=A0A852ZGG5_9ACTN|nr:hypothetical protein [Actinopolymorpha rutila]NYH91255.1 hypothetical protein [Actinopolymorpha rutila]